MVGKKRSPKTVAPKSSRPLMMGYGLPESKKGLLPWKWAERRLKQSHNYWITTVKPDKTPHTMVVWGLWLDGAFLFSTGSQSRKARNLARNKSCVVCTENASEAVVVEGTAESANLDLRRRVSQEVSTQVQVRYEQHGEGHSLHERACFCGAASSGVWIVREEVYEQRHALEV